MPKINFGTEAQSEARKQTSVRRPSCLVRLLFNIHDAAIWIARAVADLFIEGLASYGMAYACYVPGDRINSSALRPSKDADCSFEQTMSKLRALAHASSLPGSLPPRSQPTDL